MLKRLLADLEAGKIDCVVVYKVDRLSRSLLDFARTKLVVDEDDAQRVRQIFELYLEYQPLLPTVTERNRRGWSDCPSPPVPAGEIERFVVEQIKCIGRDPAVAAETVRQIRGADGGDHRTGRRRARRPSAATSE